MDINELTIAWFTGLKQLARKLIKCTTQSVRVDEGWSVVDVLRPHSTLGCKTPSVTFIRLRGLANNVVANVGTPFVALEYQLIELDDRDYLAEGQQNPLFAGRTYRVRGVANITSGPEAGTYPDGTILNITAEVPSNDWTGDALYTDVYEDDSPWIIRPDDFNLVTNPKVWVLNGVTRSGNPMRYNASSDTWHDVFLTGTGISITHSIDENGITII
jgi:hypothetical protein